MTRKLEYIHWVDSFGVGASWDEIDDMLDLDAIVTCHSVGWVAKETKDYVLIVPHWHDKQQVGENRRVNESGCGDMAIPKRSILTRVVLRKR